MTHRDSAHLIVLQVPEMNERIEPRNAYCSSFRCTASSSDASAGASGSQQISHIAQTYGTSVVSH